MALVVKPISAMLTKDLDLFGKMVCIKIFRILMLSVLWGRKRKELRLIVEVERNLNGPILLSLIRLGR